MNKQRIEIIGRVVVKPQLQKSKSKKDYSKIRVAVNKRTKDQKGKEVDLVTYYDVLVFGKRAERSPNLEKGTLVRVLGDLEVRTYLTKNKEPKADLSVMARELHVFDTEAFK